MKIAVIGAGIAGLTAGRELAKAGHEVVVFEKSRGFGGRMATRYAGKDDATKLDHGISYLSAEGSRFQSLLEELQVNDILVPWEGSFAHRDEKGTVTTEKIEHPRYVAPKGMNSVGRYLGRMLDVQTGEKVGGLTHIGEHRSRKRTWMINFSSARTESADAVIIATPSRQAYGLLNTTIDEIETLNLVREIDEVDYDSRFTLLAGYQGVEMPEWNSLTCEDDVIGWISNETTKKRENKEQAIVVHSTPEFAAKHRNANREEVADAIRDRLSEILGGWAGLPAWEQVHFWRYSQTPDPLPHDFMEIEGKGTPLALVGDYLNGNTVESAFNSGLKLGKHWAKKFSE